MISKQFSEMQLKAESQLALEMSLTEPGEKVSNETNDPLSLQLIHAIIKPFFKVPVVFFFNRFKRKKKRDITYNTRALHVSCHF